MVTIVWSLVQFKLYPGTCIQVYTTLGHILGNDLSPGARTNSDGSSPFVASSPIPPLPVCRILDVFLWRATTSGACALSLEKYVVENMLPTNFVSLLDYLGVNNSVYEISILAYSQFLITIINAKSSCTDSCIHVISSVSHKDVRKGHLLLEPFTLWRPDAVILMVGTMENKFRDMNLDIMMLHGKKVIVVVDTIFRMEKPVISRDNREISKCR
ncbi:hypothetical protein V1508DRAFT_69769 [Lipomyces doorenjongii]|uniref:uncharacterized protein n=1 Tax=Lipomyces doorenjongii TaxID=383834 RepID=UPI0034CFB318